MTFKFTFFTVRILLLSFDNLNLKYCVLIPYSSVKKQMTTTSTMLSTVSRTGNSVIPSSSSFTSSSTQILSLVPGIRSLCINITVPAAYIRSSTCPFLRHSFSSMDRWSVLEFYKQFYGQLNRQFRND